MPVPAPRGWMPESTLKPRTAGRESRITSIIFMHTALGRDTPKRSMAKEIIFSKTAITVESAAKDKNRKNRVPQILPPAIWLKIWGRVMKIREGPASGSTPKAKQAGIMISPAINATKVSKIPMLMASPVRERSLPR